jgi:Tfp pilus assembly protein PilN
MIEINLVPKNLRKRKKRGGLSNVKVNIPKEMIVGICGGFFVLLSVSVVMVQIVIGVKYIQNKGLKKQWAAIEQEKNRVDVVKNKLRILQGKIKAVENIAQGMNYEWFKKLNALSDNLPRGVWLRRVSFQDEMLFIEGSAVAKGKDEMINVHSMAANLKGDPRFMESIDDFEIGSIQRRNIKTTEIVDFIIKARLK